MNIENHIRRTSEIHNDMKAYEAYFAQLKKDLYFDRLRTELLLEEVHRMYPNLNKKKKE